MEPDSADQSSQAISKNIIHNRTLEVLVTTIHQEVLWVGKYVVESPISTVPTVLQSPNR